jgi:mono/diheme cytochrome c family protein
MVGLLIPIIPVCAQTPVERGKYLVEHVAHCGDCHTPTTPQGKPDMTKWLKGVNGRISTPDITASGALWTNWKEEGFLSFLEKGRAPSGQPAHHPMPPFKLRPDDAGAIVQYLKTLK